MPKSKITLIMLIMSILSIASSSKSGLLSQDGRPLQLLDLQTNALVEGPYVHIAHILTYKNPFDQPLETEFYFPRTEKSVFHRFEATFQNQTIVGKIFEKQEAREMYEWNVERGNTVAYSEQNSLVPDVMQVKVGNIPPHESVSIKFSIVQPLEVIINKFWGFTLPSVLTERYASSSVDASQIPNIQNVGLAESAYKEWKVTVEIRSDTPFEYILNPSHKLKPQITQVNSGTSSKIYKAFWDVTIVPNKDFVIYFRPEKLQVPSVILGQHPEFKDDQVLLVNFVPELNNLNIPNSLQELERGEEGLIELRNFALDDYTRNAKGEFIFVIDRSGSMQGLRIENLKKALTKFLQILPKDSFFNIISFGSTFSLYKPSSIKYTPSTLAETLEWITSINADMGGTEILYPLNQASSLPPINGYPRTVMLLTDGDVYGPDQVINHALINSDRMRFCSVGIGYGASEHLIKNVAKAGKCTSVFVQDNEDIGDKALYIVKAAISRYIENINFNIECWDQENKLVYEQNDKMGLLLKDTAFQKWIYLPNIPTIHTCKAKIEYYNSLKEEQMRDEVTINAFQTAEITDLWHKIAYDSKIKELDLQIKSNRGEASQNLKSQIVSLSVKYQVLSDYTAFLAVIKEAQQDNCEDRVKVVIPNLNSADYDIQESAPVYGRAARGASISGAAPPPPSPSYSPTPQAMYAMNSADYIIMQESAPAYGSAATHISGAAAPPPMYAMDGAASGAHQMNYKSAKMASSRESVAEIAVGGANLGEAAVDNTNVYKSTRSEERSAIRLLPLYFVFLCFIISIFIL